MSTIRPLSVLAICGSLRRASYNRMLLKAAISHLPADTHLRWADLSEIPLFNEDMEQQSMPRSVEQFRNEIKQADALLIATPEYNHSVSGALKNAIDWASRSPNPPLSGKPIGIMGASSGAVGTVRAQMALRVLCVSTQMLPMGKPELLVTYAQDKFDSDGNLVDPSTQKVLALYMKEWLGWVDRMLADG